MTHGSLNERITRSLAYMLRHQPEEFDLEVDPYGYAELGDVVHALSERLDEPIEEQDVMVAIESGDRPRYEVAEMQIRALYGHSFTIDPGEPSEPPELLYLGLGSRDASRAEGQGLRGGRRAFLHLALSYADAQEMGRRVSPEYSVVTVYAQDASSAGVPFYDRQSLFLSDAIPTEFIEVGEVHTDGLRRESRGGRTRRRPGERGERRDRVQGRARRGRDEDPEQDRGRDRDREERDAHRDDPRETERSGRAESTERPVLPEREEPTPEPPVSAFGSGLVEEQAPPELPELPESVEPEPVETEPAEPESAETESAETESVETESAETESVEPESAETEPAEPESVEPEIPDPAEAETTLTAQEDEPGIGFGAGLS